MAGKAPIKTAQRTTPVPDVLRGYQQESSKSCSMLEGIVNTASSHTSRLHATLNQLNTIEDHLIGSPIASCGIGSAGGAEKGRPPLLVELQSEQSEASKLLDEIGFTIDRILEAVRK